MDVSIPSQKVRTLGLASFEMSTSINMAQRAFRELLKTCLAHHDLTISQWALLGLLYTSPSVRPQSAARSLGLKPSYIARLIHELTAFGAISSLMVEDDERGKEISLTAVGHELVERVEAKLTLCLTEQFHGVPDADLQTYFAMTSFIATNVAHKA